METDSPKHQNFIGAGAAERYSGLHRKVLARMALRGDILGHKPGGRNWQYDIESIDAYFEQLRERKQKAS
jgi:hypothetical protein